MKWRNLRKNKQEEKAEFEKRQAEEKASTRSTHIGEELTPTNIQLYIIQWTKKKHTNFSASDLREKILELEPDTDIKTLDTILHYYLNIQVEYHIISNLDLI